MRAALRWLSSRRVTQLASRSRVFVALIIDGDYEGSGGPPVRADVGIVGDRVAKIGALHDRAAISNCSRSPGVSSWIRVPTVGRFGHDDDDGR